MEHLIGMDEVARTKTGAFVPVVLDTRLLINGHMLFAGMSGGGKSYQLMALMAAAKRHGIEMDVFDPHEELDGIPGAASVKFSESTRAGYNPLELDVDPHSGGVRRQIEAIITMIGRTSRALGPRQESALRNLLADVYAYRGIYADQPATWERLRIREEQHASMLRARDYQGLRDYYPILQDVISLAERKLKEISTGSDSACVNALEKVESTSRRIQSLRVRYRKADSDADIEKLEAQLVKEKEKAIEAYSNFVNGIELGREYAAAIRFTNRETMISLVERLQGLLASGVMRSNPPDWGGASTRVYKVGSLTEDDSKLLFYSRASAILRESMNRGKTDQLRRILVVDEGHLYYSEDGDNPLNRIAKEGRKFGLGLVVGSQSPTHFSEDFLTNCGSIFLLGLHESYWDMATRKLAISKDMLQAVRMREVLLVKLREMGTTAASFRSVNVTRDVISRGIQAMQRQAA